MRSSSRDRAFFRSGRLMVRVPTWERTSDRSTVSSCMGPFLLLFRHRHCTASISSMRLSFSLHRVFNQDWKCSRNLLSWK